MEATHGSAHGIDGGSSTPDDNVDTGDSSQLAVAAPSEGLHFVNFSISTESREERQRKQKLVRSAAMRNFRRQQKIERTKAQAMGSADATSSSNHSSSLFKLAMRPSDLPESPPVLNFQPDDSVPTTSFQDSASPVPDLVDELYKISNSQILRKSDSQTSKPLYWKELTSSRIDRLGSEYLDPFDLYPVDIGGPKVNELLGHSMGSLWPAFLPPSSPGEKSRLALAWHHRIRDTRSPLVMHAMLYGAAIHMGILQRISLPSPTSLFHKVQTMRFLKQELSSSKGLRNVDLDGLLLSILTLGTNEVETTINIMKDHIPNAFNPPLQGVQWLEVYGSILHVPEHTAALVNLVAHRGGLECIELEGLAEVLSFADILGATQKVTKPHWPLLHRMRNFAPDLKLPLRSPRLRALGSGFANLLSIGVSAEAYSVFQSLASVTVIVDAHLRGTSFMRNLTNYINRRNTTQHRLMSLPAALDLPPAEISSPLLYEAVRYTAMIYSIAVTFPLPPITGLFRQLAHTLRSLIEDSQLDPCWEEHPKTVLWILTLGGISASGSPDRDWYVEQMGGVCTMLGLSLWQQVVGELENFLWLDSACEFGGRDLWAEVQQRGRNSSREVRE